MCGVKYRARNTHLATKSHQAKAAAIMRREEKERAAALTSAPSTSTSEQAATDKGPRSRAWQFTLNNYVQADEDRLHNLDCEYIVYGHEVGASGTPHLQGYVYFGTQRTLSVLKKKVHPTAHFEPARGNADQNYAYCTKEGREIYERGTRPHAGTRTDIAAMKELVKGGASIGEVIDSASSYQELKAAELLMKYQPMPDRREVVIHWYYGATGTGKTYAAFEEAKAASAVPGDIWISGRNLEWWQGYQGQHNVILDDFRGDFCEFHTLLRYLDVYPIMVNFKGGSTWLRATHIWITSPYPPERVFMNRTAEDLAQLTSRIGQSNIREFTGPNRRIDRVELTGADILGAIDKIDATLESLAK